jgi:APA family basic amino acid/polyamine antiporter
MGALYAVGSLLAFMFSHASIIGLRIRKPDLERPFKLGWNIRIGGRQIPFSAVFGFLTTSSIWVIILITQPYSRWVGLGWMVLGMLIFLYLGFKKKKPSEEWEIKPKKH